MSLARIIGVRVAMGLAVAWGVLSLVFAMFTLTDDWVLNADLAELQWGGAEDEVIEAVREEYFMQRGLDQPIQEVYLDWLVNMVTLEWGESFVSGEPALSMVAGGVIETATYLLPALVIAIALAILVGLVAGLQPRDRWPRVAVFGAYLLFVVPMFWVGALALTVGLPEWVYDPGLPIALTAGALLGGYISYTRAHTMEYAGREFTKLVRSKGASNVQVARHVLRNAAIPFFSMLFTEAMMLLLLAVFVVESVFAIDGLGLVILQAAEQRDLPVMLGGVVVVIAFGATANIIQDVSYSYFDPRVDTGRR
ncbi:MAG: ABC transporter permease [Halobacteriales archaeon]